MPNTKGAKTMYVPPKYAWIFEKFSLEEIDTYLRDSPQLFETMAETPKSKMVLEINKKLAEVVEKL